MKIIDLTHTVKEDMPVYPGTEGPCLEQCTDYEREGYKETLLSMYSHTGTHMDAPAHIYGSGKTLDTMEAEAFVGKCFTVDCKGIEKGRRITMDMIDIQKSSQAEFILFNTGWSRYWGTDQYFSDYPYVTEEVIDYIRDSGKKGIGFDTIGLDPVSDTNLSLHRRLLKDREIVIIENLKNLETICGQICTLYCLPLKYKGADGAPARAVALL